MSNVFFDHEKLAVYRLAVDYGVIAYRMARSLGGSNRHIRDQWLRAAGSIALNIAEGNGKRSIKEKSRFFEIARGSALECAAIHDLLIGIRITERDQNQVAKRILHRIVSMLTRLIQRAELS